MTIWTADTPFVCGWSFNDENDCANCLSKIAGKEALFQSAVNSAAEILYALSGRQFGLCEISLRPCRRACTEGSGYGGTPWTPKLVDGEWMNLKCGACKTDCSCTEVCDFVLPARAYDIIEINLNGEILPPTAYRIDNQRRLVSMQRPVPLLGDFQISTAFLDPSATVTADIPATSVLLGVDLGGGVYGPVPAGPSAGIIQLVWNGIDCVNITYDGPAPAAFATTRPAPAPNVATEAWNWPAPGFNFVAGTPVTSSSHEDGSSVVGTLVSGTAVTSNPNPPPQARNIILSPGSQMEFCPSQVERFCWPLCQDMSAAEGEPNTFTVKYHRGLPIPSAGERSLAQLACELFLACIGDDCCALPSRVTSLTREGVTMAMLDPMEFISIGKTGLYSVDLWLQSVNPKAAPRRGAILSPDMPQFRQTTWPT